MKICVDASLVIKVLALEKGSQQAATLFNTWRQANHQLMGPSLLDYEVSNAIHKKLLSGEIEHKRLYNVYSLYSQLNLIILHQTHLLPEILPATASLEQKAIYDSSYLILAKQQDIDLITADYRFYRAAHPSFPFVKYYEDCL